MPFGAFKTLGDALETFQIRETRESFITPSPVKVSDYFRAELEITLTDMAPDITEAAVCENLIYPVLREAIKPYLKVLSVWSHLPLYAGDELLGIPDYLIGKRSALSVRIVGMPCAMIMEAKRNDFDGGWGQCIAAMHAVQRLNGEPPRVVYGVVSDGFIWRFGKLQDQIFTLDPEVYQLNRLDELLGGLHHVLELCKQQVLMRADAA